MALWLRMLGGGWLVCLTMVAPASADEVSDFYTGKTISMVVGHEPGTGFDIYTRVIYRHMARYIPGSPSMIVQNMPGASGIQSANWLYNIAPRDGTVMATFTQNVPLEPLFGNKAAKFDPSKFIWIGNAEQTNSLCGVSAQSGIKTFADLQKKETIFGATGPTGPLIVSALAVKNLMGGKLRIVPGYKGSASVKAAMLNGEVHGICGLGWSTINSFWKSEVDTGEFKVIVQLSGEPMKALGDIPHARDFAKTEADKQLFGILLDVQVLGRLYMLPPGVPQPRVEALRKAFMDTMRDAKFVEDATRTGLEISPMTGEAVEKLWKGFTATPPEIVERAKEVIRLQ